MRAVASGHWPVACERGAVAGLDERKVLCVGRVHHLLRPLAKCVPAAQIASCARALVCRNILDMYADMCADMCVEACGEMCVAMCVGVWGDMCMDMCADMCVDISVVSWAYYFLQPIGVSPVGDGTLA